MATDSVLSIRRLVWWQVVRQLRVRGRGVRESGAFLLGARTDAGGTVTAFVCYDDVDPQALDTGIVVMRSSGFRQLWQICRQYGLDVLADVHTHGDAEPRQSATDRQNPAIAEPGHIALILPSFAQVFPTRLGNTAVYEYLGGYQWRAWNGAQRHQRVKLSVW